MADQSLKDYYNRRKTELEQERSSFISHWQELADFISPRRGRFIRSDVNKGDKRHNNIINSRASQAHKIARSGMLAGTMSPSRPWFSLETHDPDLMEHPGVRDYLYKVERLIRSILNESNFYGMASQFLGDLILFGTSCMTHVDDFDSVARFYTHTAGSYSLGINDKQKVDTILREFEWSAIQIVQAFGIQNVSASVKNAVDKGNYLARYPVCHIIEPNDDYRPSSKLSKNKLWKSVYYEPSDREDKFLEIRGFDEFPAYAPRWDATDGDIYGTDCPGMTALGDVKQLQLEEKRKAQGIDMMVFPPLTGPPSVRNVPISSLPGGLTVFDGDDQKQALRSLYNVNLPLQELRIDIDAVERRINEAFYVDMFLAISNMEGIQPRNQLDIMQRNEERLLQLGPVLERLHSDFLDQLIDRVYNQCARADILPPPPPDLQGQALKVRYVSTLAMAQRAVATQSIDRIVALAGNMASIGLTDALRKIDASQAMDEYAQAIGTPPSIIVPDEVVEQQIAAERQAMQAQQALEAAQGAANTAKMASDAKTGDRNVLTDMMNG